MEITKEEVFEILSQYKEKEKKFDEVNKDFDEFKKRTLSRVSRFPIYHIELLDERCPKWHLYSDLQKAYEIYKELTYGGIRSKIEWLQYPKDLGIEQMYLIDREDLDKELQDIIKKTKK